MRIRASRPSGSGAVGSRRDSSAVSHSASSARSRRVGSARPWSTLSTGVIGLTLEPEKDDGPVAPASFPTTAADDKK